MSKIVEELAKQFTDELFAGDDLTDFDTQTAKNDAYVMCMAFGNHLMEQPLSVRLTADEKKRVKGIYKELKRLYVKFIDTFTWAGCYKMQYELLESIFGKEFFEEEGV